MSVRVQMCSMCIVNALVVLLVFVHKTPIAPGWRFNLSRKRRRKATAGALALSKVTVALVTPLLWSGTSKSFHPSFRAAKNNTLQQVVLGLGRKKEAEMFPMAEIKLHGYISRVSSFIVDSEKFGYRPMVCHA